MIRHSETRHGGLQIKEVFEGGGVTDVDEDVGTRGRDLAENMKGHMNIEIGGDKSFHKQLGKAAIQKVTQDPNGTSHKNKK